MTASPDREAPTDVIDERGVRLTAEGLQRAREQLAALDAHWTTERREEARRVFLARLDAA
jgi:hypothetical protein